MIRIEDWRGACAEAVKRLHDTECERWTSALGWDLRLTALSVERARREGSLPGFLAMESGRVVGWTYFGVKKERLQVGAFVSDDPQAAAQLLHAITQSEEAQSAREIWGFFFPVSPAIEAALSDSRFTLVRHTYLRSRGCRTSNVEYRGRDIRCSNCAGEDDKPEGHLAWRNVKVRHLASMFAHAYLHMPEGRCFARGNSVDEWSTYLSQIIKAGACGRFEPTLSAILDSPAGEATAAIVVTSLGPKTAHVAQLAVRRDCQGKGIGRQMVTVACDRAKRSGYEEVTLLVADSNTVARRLYDRLGFTPVAPFLFAYRDEIR